jgi:phage recombination protein Bet
MSTDIVQAGGALAIRADQTEWTPAQQAVLQQSGISNDVTAAELSGFLHLCQRTQLDPFSRQIYLIGRKDKRAGRTVFTPQTGIDGYRVVAHRVVAASREAFGYEDTQWCDASGRWRDVWLSDAPPAAARVTVLRNGQRFPAIAVFREYVQAWDGKPTGLWAKMPAGQLAKCAEALALRKAFPHDLAGVYTAEEMAQADNPAPAEQGPAQVRQLRRVQPSEPDPWQTDGPSTAGPAAEPRDFLHEAHEAPAAQDVRRIWQEAKAFGSHPDYLEQIAAVGRQKAAAAQSAPVEDGIADAEVVGEPDERTAALDELRAIALGAGLAANLDNDFRSSYGVAPADATVEQLREATALIGSAA